MIYFDKLSYYSCYYLLLMLINLRFRLLKQKPLKNRKIRQRLVLKSLKFEFCLF